MPPVAGCRFAAVEAGVRYKGRRDVLLAEFAPGTTVAGVLTRNIIAAIGAGGVTFYLLPVMLGAA